MRQYPSGRGLLSVFALSMALFMAGGPVQAQLAGVYVGLDVSEVEFDSPGFSSPKPNTVGLNVGTRLTRHFGTEARIGMNLSDDDIVFLANDSRFGFEVNNYYGFHGTGHWPLSDMFELYGQLGYTYSEVKFSFEGQSQKTSNNGLSYGIGATFDLTYSTTIRLEWSKMMDGSDYELDALSLGIRFNY